MKQFLIIFGVIILIGAIGIILILRPFSPAQPPAQKEQMDVDQAQQEEPQQVEEDLSQTVIGASEGGNEITAYHYGTGDTEVLFVGGVHGGYSWNTVSVMYELMDYLEENEADLAANLKVTVIPVFNPDGLEEVMGTTSRFSIADIPDSVSATVEGRFNANGVDLNRNFECDWESEGTWQNRTVDGGDAVFSESESVALRDYVLEHEPAAAVVYYASAGGVFASSCHNGVSADTKALTKLYAEASGYKAYEEFDFYEITGDMVNWLAKEGIPAISVLLTNHKDVEWSKNRLGIEALLEYYAQ